MRRAFVGVALALIASGCLMSGCASDSDAATGEPSPDAAQSSASNLQVGDCVRLVQDPDSYQQYLDVADCAAAHHGEVVLAQADFFAAWRSFPSEEQIVVASQTACDEAMLDYSGLKAAEASFRMSYLYPTEESWQEQDRKLTCVAMAYDSAFESLLEIGGSVKKPA